MLELATRPGKDESQAKDDAHGFGKRRLAPIDTAPLGDDVLLQVTDGRGEPYNLPNLCRLTESGWVSSTKGAPLAVTPVKWKPYNGPRSRLAR
jgi:hypothetical protein